MQITITQDQADMLKTIIEIYSFEHGSNMDINWWEELVDLRRLFGKSIGKKLELKAEPMNKTNERRKLLSEAGCTTCADFEKSCSGFDTSICKYNAEMK